DLNAAVRQFAGDEQAWRHEGLALAQLRDMTNEADQRLDQLSEANNRAYFSHVPTAQAVGSPAPRGRAGKDQLTHPTPYAYGSSVDSAQHIAHLRPRAFRGQHISAINIETNPVPALAVGHVDHFGNSIDIYRLDKPHKRFEIEVRAAIEVRFPDPPPA